jgi:chromosomal replication initiation ATPase DnaA
VPLGFVRLLLEQAVSQIFAVDGADMWADTRGPARTVVARQVAMYLGHVACGLSFTDVGRVFCRDRTTVAHACQVVEDMRDDRRLDRTLELLEAVVRFLVPQPATPFRSIA